MLKQQREAIEQYRILRGMNIHKAWELSNMDCVRHLIISVIAWITFCGCILYLVSSKANAWELDARSAVKTELKQLQEENKQLQDILARCLSSSERSIIIGDEIYLCHAVSIGEKVK